MKRSVTALFATILFASISFGADISFTITRAEVGCEMKDGVLSAQTLEFIFDKSLNEKELIRCTDDMTKTDCEDKRTKLRTWIQETFLKDGNYLLLQIESGDPATITGITPPPPNRDILDNTLGLKIGSGYDISKGYILVAKNVTQGKSVPFMIKAEPNSSCEPIPKKVDTLATFEKPKGKEEEKEKKIEDYIGKPANKESPILKVDFGIQGAKRQQAIYSFNVKFRPYTTRRLGLGGHYDLTYFFLDTEYKINAKDGDKKNVLNVGLLDLNYTKVWRDDGGELSNEFTRRFPGVALSLTPKMETEWRFKQMNFLLSPKFTFPINVYQSRRTTLQINPFAGIDLGIRAKGMTDKPGWQIQRPFFGTGLTGNFYRKNDKPRVAVQIDYTRRLFLRSEFSYGYGADGTEIADASTKTPRDHVKAKIIFNVKELFSPFVEYEYGRVPPKYSLINSSFKTGVIFDIDLMWKTFLK